MNRFNLTLVAWRENKSAFHSADTSQQNPSVFFHNVTLGICFWNIINLDAEILISDLKEMMLNIKGSNEVIRNKDISSRVPHILLVNSTVKSFMGMNILLTMHDSLIMVNTQEVVSSVFVIMSSTVGISNCTFLGINNDTNMPRKDTDRNTGKGSFIYGVGSMSKIVIRESLFENIQMPDIRYDVSTVIYVERSQIEIYNSSFMNNTAISAAIHGTASNLTVAESVFSENLGHDGASICAQENSHLDVHNSTFTYNKAVYGAGIIAGFQTSLYVTDSIFAHNVGQQGASINVQRNSYLEIHNTRFIANKAFAGSGIAATSKTSVYAISCLFSQNSCQQDASCTGGGILGEGQTSVYISDSLFTHNSCPQGASVGMLINSNLEIHNSTFMHNNATHGAGINSIHKSSVYVIDSIFSQNSAKEGASIVVEYSSNLEVHNSTFKHNIATNKSDIVVIYQTSVHITGCDFSHNLGVQSASIYIQQHCNLKVDHSTFIDNKAIGYGTCIAAQNLVTVHVTDSLFINNSATTEALEKINSNVHGQGFHKNQTAKMFPSENVNSSTLNLEGLGVLFKRLNLPESHQLGKISNQPLNFKSRLKANAKRHSDIERKNNTDAAMKSTDTGYGGAVYVGYSSLINITSCLFKGNKAFQGGVLNGQQDSSVFIINSTFTANYASDGAVILAMTKMRLHIETSTFEGNKASSRGTVLAIAADVNVTMSDCRFIKNIGNDYCGVIFALNANATLSRCQFLQNTAPTGSAFWLENSYLTASHSHFLQHSSNVGQIKDSYVILRKCLFLNNSFRQSILEAPEKSYVTIKNSHFAYNEIGGIIFASKTLISINKCKFTKNIVTGVGIINSGKAVLTFNDSIIHNNSIHRVSGITHDSVNIAYSKFTNNTVDHNFGLIQSTTGEMDSTLKIEHSTFLYNHGDVLHMETGVDIVLNECNFTGNYGDMGTICLWNDGATLRTSNTTITAPAEGNKVAIYIGASEEGTKLTDYMTYNTSFISGNTTLNSSLTDTFLLEAEEAHLVVVKKQVTYTVTQEETVFASCKYGSISEHSNGNCVTSEFVVYPCD